MINFIKTKEAKLIKQAAKKENKAGQLVSQAKISNIQEQINNIINSIRDAANRLNKDTVILLQEWFSTGKYSLVAKNKYLGEYPIRNNIASSSVIDIKNWSKDIDQADKNLVNKYIDYLRFCAQRHVLFSPDKYVQEFKDLKINCKKVIEIEREQGMKRIFWSKIKREAKEEVKQKSLKEQNNCLK